MSMIVVGLSALLFCVWVVALGGLAAMQDNGAGKRTLSYEWWIISYQFVLFCMTIGAALVSSFFAKFRQSLLAMTAVATMLWIELCNKWWTFNHSPADYDIEDQINTFVGGCIMTATVSFFLLIALGMPHEEASHAKEAAHAKEVAEDTKPANAV